MENLKLIGSGSFTKVYELNSKQVLIHSVDYVKECNAYFGLSDFGFPKIKRLSDNIYLSKKYNKVVSLKNELRPKQYEIYKELRGLSVPYNTKPYDYLNEWRKVFYTVKNSKFRNALLEALDNLSNYGSDISFEISPRNVAVEKGNLILLDCFFLRSQLDKTRKQKNILPKYEIINYLNK